MSNYKVSTTGYNVALGSLVTLVPQPRSDGIKVARRTYAADGTVYGEGVYIELEYNIVKSPVQLDLIYDQFGLDITVSTKQITILIPGVEYTDTRYNGLAVRPLIGPDLVRQNYFLRRLIILVKFLELAS